MSDEERARFETWWNEYLQTCQRFSTGGTDWALCDSTESIAWQAWQAANMAQEHRCPNKQWDERHETKADDATALAANVIRYNGG